jgi:16S rRNA (cytosine967-C5)-methyltransferase
MKSQGLSPRIAALQALLNWKNGNGFVQSNLQQTCENLPQNDRALAYEIALGTCRALTELDAKLKTLMRELPKEPCKTILEISLYQLLHTRIPSYATVNSAGYLARFMGLNEHSVKFVNAVLRNALRKNFEKIDSEKAPAQWIRVNPQKTNVKELIAKLALQNPEILFNKFILVASTREILKNPLFEKGFYSFQNPASFFVAGQCEIKAGYKIWDACAAPGGKTALLAEENPDAFFVASDCNEKRAEKILDLKNRLGLENVRIVLANVEKPPFSQKFDCVIVDAPCSNMGVVSRRPEALQTFSKEKISELSKKQLAILQCASVWVKESGVLIYSVCSQEKEESIEVIEKFIKNNPNFTQEETIFTNLPHIDKFFITKLRRTKN